MYACDVDREAIERWLEEHETSPLTGAKLTTTMVFRNYSVLTTIEELRHKNEEARRQQLEHLEADVKEVKGERYDE